MAGKNEAKIKFTADTSELNSQIKSANTTMSALRAEMALNEAEFKNTGDAAEYLNNKQKILNDQLEVNQAKQEALNGKLEAAKRIYGENSDEATQMATKLTNAQKEEQQLKTKLNETEKAIEEQNSALDKNEQELDDVSDAAKEAGDAQEKANSGWTMAKGIVADLVSTGLNRLVDVMKDAVKEVVKLGTEFTSSLSNVQALSGASASEMGKLETKAKALGRSTVFSAKDVSDAFGYMSLAGWETSEMLEGVDGVLNLAASSQMELADASDMVTDYLSAFGLEAQDASRMADMLAYAQAHSNTTAEQLGDAYGNSAAQMHTAGQSIETTTALLEAFANQGTKGSEAGTELSAMMRDITQKMKDGKIMIGDTAVTVKDSNGNFRNMIDILADVEAATDGMGSAEKSAALMTTFTARSVKGVSEALTEGVDNIRGYENALYGCQGAASDMSAVMNDNLAGDMTKLNSAAQGLGLELFNYFEGPLRESAQLATDFINDLTDAITPQENILSSFIDDIEKANAEVQGKLDSAHQTMTDLEKDVGKFEAYKTILLELNGVEEKSEWQKYQMKYAVEALSDTVPGLKEAFDEETGSLRLTNEQIIAMINNSERLAVQNAIMKASEEAYAAWGEAVVNAQLAEAAFAQAQSEYNDSMAGTAEGIYVYNKEQAEAAKRLGDSQRAQQTANETLAEAEETLNSIKGAQEAYFESLEPKKVEETSKYQEQYGATIRDTADANEEAAISEEEKIAAEEAAAAASAAEAERIKSAYEAMRDSISSSVKSSISMLNQFDGGQKIAAKDILANLQSQTEGLNAWVANMEELGAMAGRGMNQNLYDSLVEMGPSAANLVQELVDTLHNDTEQFEAISNEWGESLSIQNDAELLANYTSAGKEMAGATVAGFEEEAGGIEASISETTASASKEADFSGVADEAKKAVGDAKTNLDEGKDVAKAGVDAMKNAIQSSSGGMTIAMKTAMSGVAGQVTSAMSTALGNVNTYMSLLSSALNKRLSGPHIEVPHFTLSGSFNLKTLSVPKVGVSWWAKGGIFTQPTIIPTMYGMQGVGEAGPEAVLPIDTLKGYISDVLETSVSPVEINNYWTVDGAQDPEAWAVDVAREMKQQMRIS